MLAKEFKTIVLPLSNKLLRFALQFTKNEEEARDTIQDVFLKLWQKRNTLEGIENIEAFAMRMTRNRCLDLYRGKHTYSLEDQTDSWQQKRKGDLNEELELSETATIIKRLIGELPDLQRQVMQMRDIDQLSYDEIAENTGLNINAIRVNLSRARKKIRTELLNYQDYGTAKNKTNTAQLF
ncbi:RNA polymerase sigma-70 factor, ECF subfamily [Sunxiuqinia elliptica]|uniref:RNA polymerase sigma-70 factor, ECF subfamily n=2 Tax=Sunxiuqinia elliptica TaxID=655355 RepID=A0A1I2KGQ1_9BACT|nr:RNA polymerase sigma-70 factor, ECF subfamily [Sunxiuqinia elliptica]